MKASFVRKRSKSRGVLTLPGHMADLAPLLRHKNFSPIVVLPANFLEEEQKGAGCQGVRSSPASRRSWTTTYPRWNSR